MMSVYSQVVLWCLKDRFQVIIMVLEMTLFDVMNVDIPSEVLSDW